MIAYTTRFAVVVLFLVGLTGRAWADGTVTSASAVLDVRDAQVSRVEIEVGVRVTAGSLLRFELADLDADLVLSDEQPPVFLAADGRSFVPAVNRPETGMLVFEFADKHAAPGRGEYTLRVAYRTRALSGGGTSDALGARTITWSLPRWPNRLGDVEIRVLAPLGTRAAASSERLRDSDRIDVRELQQGVELAFQRVELPRTQAFTLRLVLPPTAASNKQAVASDRSSDARMPTGIALGLGLLIGLLWLAKRRLNARAHQTLGLAHSPLWPLPAAGARDCASFVLCAGAIASFEQLPVLAAISGVLGCVLASDTGGAAIAMRSDAQKKRLGTPRQQRFAADWFDATTPVGALSALGFYTLLVWLHVQRGAAIGCAGWLGVALFLSDTRASRNVLRETSRTELTQDSRAQPQAGATTQTALLTARVAAFAQLAFLRSSSITVSSSLSSRPMTSGCGSKSTSADCSSS